jgi:hypothetical protein
VVELARGPGSLANTGRVDRSCVFEHRAGRRGAVGDLRARAGAVGLGDAQVFAVVDEAVGRGARIGDARHPVGIVVGERGGAAAYSPAFSSGTSDVSVGWSFRSSVTLADRGDLPCSTNSGLIYVS